MTLKLLYWIRMHLNRSVYSAACLKREQGKARFYVGTGGSYPQTSACPRPKYFCYRLTASACRCKRSVLYVAFKIRQNAFPPWTPWGSSEGARVVPQSLYGWGGVTPLPIPYLTRRLGLRGIVLKYFPLEPRLHRETCSPQGVGRANVPHFGPKS